MEYSSNKPLGLQVYKTPAEYKALRLNRTEQCRLNCERTYISRQERNFHKDFKTSRIKIEAQFQRRLSMMDGQAGCGGCLSITPFTPRIYAPSSAWSDTASHRSASVRRASEMSSSTRRSSAWSAPTRTQLLQRRRQTYTVGYGGGSAHYLSRSASSFGRNSMSGASTARSYRKASALASVSGKSCDFCDGVSDVMTTYRDQDGADKEREEEGRDVNEPGPRVAGGEGVSGGNVNSGDHPALPSDPVPKESNPVTKETETPHGEEAPVGESSDSLTDLTDVSLKPPRARTAHSQRSLRRFSRMSSAVRGFNARMLPNSSRAVNPVSSLADPQPAGVATEDKNDSKDYQRESNLNAEASESQAVAEATENGLKKADRKVSILEPSEKNVSARTKTPALTVRLQLNEVPDDDLKVHQDALREHAEHCLLEAKTETEGVQRNSAVLGTHRENATAFVKFGMGSGSFGKSSVLQGRISRFLDQQRDFNRRFPLNCHEVRSLESTRPDLLRITRVRQEAETLSKEKESMIAEVLDKLGLEDISNDEGEQKSKKLFPPLK